jgi:hypothetical protein
MHIIVFLLALALGCPRASSSSNAMPVDTPAGERCVLSVVMVGRNDEWQAGGGLGNFSTRLAASVTAFILHAERLKLKCEVIVVDYNPPHDTLSLRRQFFRQATGVQGSAWRHSDLIFVTVPHTVHVQVKKITVWRAYDAKLFEYVAKNAGLRAARCKYVLVTNPDIVPGRTTMDFLHSSLSHTAAERRGVSDDVNDLPLSLSLSDGKFVTMARTPRTLASPSPCTWCQQEISPKCKTHWHRTPPLQHMPPATFCSRLVHGGLKSAASQKSAAMPAAMMSRANF